MAAWGSHSAGIRKSGGAVVTAKMIRGCGVGGNGGDEEMRFGFSC